MANEFKPALIVVDMQYDFIYGTLVVPDADTIVGKINQLLDPALPFVKKIGTKDYHPPDHISFASRHDMPIYSTVSTYPPGYDGDQSMVVEQTLWPDHCVASTPGSEFTSELDSGALDVVVHKATDPDVECYSAFQDVWKVTSTYLPWLLSKSGATDVYVCGVAGDFCVKYTALDAVKFGYQTWVIRDAVKSVSTSGDEWKEMEEGGVKIITLKEALEKLGK